MSLFAFFLVMIAVVSHAVWNFIVKSSSDRLGAMVMMLLGISIMGFVMLPFATLPSDTYFWGLVALSALLHWAYNINILLAYRFSDLSLAYPIARGAVPIIVLIAAYLVLGQLPSLQGIAGVTCVSLGIMALAIFSHRIDPRGAGLAILTSFWIAGYTLVDGLGVRLENHAYAFVALIFASHALIPLVTLIFVWRLRVPNSFVRAFPAAILSVLAYAPVLWAQRTSDFAAVSALRETSVIVASLIGVLILGEKQAGLRLGAAVLVCFGAVLVVAT